MKRIKLKPKNPNPLFELWLEEWRKEAASRNSDLQYHFSRALAALKKYPLPLKSGKDCIILQHFGTKLCFMLDRKLKEYKAQNNDSTSVKNVCKHCSFNEQPVFKRKHRSQQIIVDADFVPEKTDLTTFDDLNLSTWNIENYAALLILYKKTQDSCYLGYTTETDLLLEMKQLCGHEAKTSVLDLFECGLISMIGRPIRYNLTEHGISISKKICEITTTDVISLNSFEVLNRIQISLKPLITQKSKLIKDSADLNNRNEDTQIFIQSGKDIQTKNLNEPPTMYKSKSVETITIQNHCQQPDKNFVKQKSKENIVYPKKVQEKTKEVKDMNHVYNLENNETDFTDDFQRNYYLESSNFDIILLVDTQETAGGRTEPQHDATITGLTEFGVSFEIRHLKVGDFAWIARCRRNKNNELILPFIVERKRIDDLSASITDGRFHEQKEKNLVGCKKEVITRTNILNNTCSLMVFEEFNKAASKQKVFKVNQMFVRQLLQLKGMSIDKALAIVEHYPTPRLLVEAFQKSDCNGELLLAAIEFGDKKRLIGSVISKTIYQLYMKKDLN
ncbi:crossover junction endonuclease MUS81 isoform X2 [Bombus pascuorum]|uniref:crossover junction endonuclease MUS81 isoform X2 n=1 Tax=Bombus pascuorum TaxID=65598 RepID=UPI00298DE908|nr:crossover junction endonuclease MUS81 isoform X2 [Bombus pascuorum]